MEAPIPDSGHEVRLLSRSNTLHTPTSGLAPGFLQANLLILPSAFSQDFLLLCQGNPIPCPLLAYSTTPGSYSTFTSCIPGIPSSALAIDLDIRTDCPKYNVYIDGILSHSSVPDIKSHWQEDHIAFLIGCSYSFESALTSSGLTPPHVKFSRNVSMYRTTLPLSPAGIFGDAKMVVSMRFYRKSQIQQVRDITGEFGITHGGPVAYGWDAANEIGVEDVNRPDWGDEPVDGEGKVVDRVEEEGQEDGYVPVFWGCGVTPQEAVMRAKVPGVVIGHSPGYMVVLDVTDEEIVGLEV